ncbi:uncharacterized protein N7459_000140 [Penicillium hispanicum]|uniref:uncharacterized protein n=1 Tax=Penicillium hispanicum TaxID=1080232 RepID=UPI0025417A4E|nr:uncharacterized protein N7459_000140 [Penicillium hispanicum]KAJ5593932.1 hypothetical protein N7459_000140 [Penicillium hispanicum]
MAPKLLAKIFKRRKEPPPKFKIKEWSPNAIGIADSTCEINGDIFNRWKLPIPPPEERLRMIGARKRNPQDQCHFFRLPAEIRRMIYLELMGDRRVHIRYIWKEPSPFRPQPKQGGPRWDWWHSVCDHSNDFPEDALFDHCWDWTDEADLKKKSPKINGVEWLRVCQIGYEEALEVLYTTNVFAMNRAMDTPFLMSRLLSPRCASLITSMDISFPAGFIGARNDEADWMAAFVAFVDLFGVTFHGVHRLRLELKMPPWEAFAENPNEHSMEMLSESIKMFLAQFDRLAKRCEWTQLQLCVPWNWREQFQKSRESMPGQAEWELTETIWSQRWIFQCFGMS